MVETIATRLHRGWAIAGAACLLSVVAVAVGDSWRTALLTVAVGSAIATTRVRFAGHAALGVLVVMAVAALGGRAISHDDRTAGADRGDSRSLGLHSHHDRRHHRTSTTHAG